jgi:hypothetical protein
MLAEVVNHQPVKLHEDQDEDDVRQQFARGSQPVKGVMKGVRSGCRFTPWMPVDKLGK